MSACVSYCSIIMWLFSTYSLRLLFWDLSILKSLGVLYPYVNLSIHCCMMSYSFEWPRCACIVGKTSVTCCHLHARRCPAPHWTWSKDVPVRIFRWKPSDKTWLKDSVALTITRLDRSRFWVGILKDLYVSGLPNHFGGSEKCHSTNRCHWWRHATIRSNGRSDASELPITLWWW